MMTRFAISNLFLLICVSIGFAQQRGSVEITGDRQDAKVPDLLEKRLNEIESAVKKAVGKLDLNATSLKRAEALKSARADIESYLKPLEWKFFGTVLDVDKHGPILDEKPTYTVSLLLGRSAQNLLEYGSSKSNLVSLNGQISTVKRLPFVFEVSEAIARSLDKNDIVIVEGKTRLSPYPGVGSYAIPPGPIPTVYRAMLCVSAPGGDIFISLADQKIAKTDSKGVFSDQSKETQNVTK